MGACRSRSEQRPKAQPEAPAAVDTKLEQFRSQVVDLCLQSDDDITSYEIDDMAGCYGAPCCSTPRCSTPHLGCRTTNCLIVSAQCCYIVLTFGGCTVLLYVLLCSMLLCIMQLVLLFSALRYALQ